MQQTSQAHNHGKNMITMCKVDTSGGCIVKDLCVYSNPSFNEIERGIYWLDVRPSVCSSVCPSVDGIVSALYLQQ